jgi:hypothetical protein
MTKCQNVPAIIFRLILFEVEEQTALIKCLQSGRTSPSAILSPDPKTRQSACGPNCGHRDNYPRVGSNSLENFSAHHSGNVPASIGRGANT